MNFFLFTAVAALTLAGCGGGGGSGVDLTGRWTGNGASTSAGVTTPTTLVFTLAQNGSAITGNVAITAPTGTSAGSVVGTFNGTALTANFLPSDPTRCPISATLIYTDNKLKGTGSAYNCTVAVSTEITISR